MFKKQELTRLGDILVSKGLITPEQLDAAIREQSRRKLLLDPLDPNAKVAPIGELLIELGFIDRLQLKRGLNWQQRLRRASIAMALCAPFMIFSPSAAASTVRPAPITVEAENYASMKGVGIENTADVGGGKNVSYIESADWMTYNNIAIPATGTYKITYRISSLNGGGSLVLKNAVTNVVLDTAALPKTGGWQTWVDVERTVTLQGGTQNFTILAAVGGFNLNWFKIESLDGTVVSSSAAAAASSTPAAASTGTTTSAASTSSTATTFPFVVEAESYSSMYGVGKETTTDVGGGQALGYVDTGDWVSYSNTVFKAPFAGKYKISYRVSSLKGGANFVLSNILTNSTIDTVSVPATGGWQVWQTIEREVTLAEGEHKFNLVAKVGGANINWFKIEPLAIPTSLLIQAEDYVKMSGIGTETTTDVGGGKNAGFIDAGDWMTYDKTEFLVPNAGRYKVTYRVASKQADVNFQLYDLDTGAILDTVPVPNTTGWQTWASTERTVQLTEGKKRFGIKATKGTFNINWFKFEPVNSAGEVINIPPPSATTSSAASSVPGSTSPTVSSSSSSAPSTTPTVSSAASSAPAQVTASSSSAPSVSVSSSSSSAPSSQKVAGPVGISWTAPGLRENGTYLDVTELGGYEIRYKKTGDSKYTYVSINDPWTNNYKFEWLEGDYIFQIAAFDKNGIYSPFVDIHKF
ncbi:MAG: carbohydrate-binding protein [Cellvibrio sp.]|uniref:carbohydrate-binding protein n=1 Tax=Cellvibrio sp. TaxID=1965322 RepID=UPI0031AF335C